MDNLTHALTGAALARTGLDRTTPLATATLVLAANVPDLDVLAYTNGPYFALAFRRGITHGVPALVVLPFVVAGAMLAWDRGVRRRRDPDAEPARPRALLGLALIGLLTHPAMDWLNTYGMRWWLPFDGTWSYGDALFIIDPWLWLLLGGAVVMGTRSRGALAAWALLAAVATTVVVTTPIPAGAKGIWGVGVALVALTRTRGPTLSPTAPRALVAAAALYVGLMLGADAFERAAVGAALATAQVGEVSDLMVGPRPANPFAADVIARLEDGYLRGEHHVLAAPRTLIDDEAFTPARAGPGLSAEVIVRAVQAASESPEVRNYLVWSRYPYVGVTAEPGGYRVRFADVRYDRRGGSLGGISIGLDEAFRRRGVEP